MASGSRRASRRDCVGPATTRRPWRPSPGRPPAERRRLGEASPTAATISASRSMPVLTASAPMSSAPRRSGRMMPIGIACTASPPGVLRGDRGDRARGVDTEGVNVLRSAWMPAPPPESEPAMIRDSAVHAVGDAVGQPRWPDSDRLAQRRPPIVVHQRLVLALGHHADHRLGAAGADQDAAARRRASPQARRSSRCTVGMLQRRGAGEAHVHAAAAAAGRSSGRPPTRGDWRSTSTASDCSAAGGRSPVVTKSVMTRWPDCSPPRLKPVRAHRLGRRSGRRRRC